MGNSVHVDLQLSLPPPVIRARTTDKQTSNRCKHLGLTGRGKRRLDRPPSLQVSMGVNGQVPLECPSLSACLRFPPRRERRRQLPGPPSDNARSGMDVSGSAVGPLLLPPSPGFPASSPASSLSQDQAKAASPGRRRFRRAATAVAHLCGLILRGKRYIDQSPLVQWATFHLQMNIRGDLLFSIRDYSKEKVQNKDFERLIHLLRICPNERTPKDILQMQLCLKTNRAFRSFPSNAQQKLCQAFIYQKYIAGTVIMKQGHMATECYLLLSGKLKFMITNEKFENGILAFEALYELEEEDFIGVFECALASIRYEQYHATCCFLRAGTTVVMDSLNSYFIVIVKSGRCTEAARLDSRAINTQDATWEMTPRCKAEKQGPQVASLAPRLLKIRTLEQGDIFGLANLMDKSCLLQLSLISEGAECIFIPKRLFLEEATAKSRQMALQMFSSYPTESMIQQSYNIQQTWNRYKSKLIKQHLKWHAKQAGIKSSNGW
ncbi:cGMP-dependent protein kinase isozyme 1-like [Crotalus adamanteus]|uniref:cGMP-dependent protein kinase isozyme 1-like n=1 Tax=Crotalus adamanteus TaxID=8729 RepID=A0AAW1BCC2_CROAD